MWLLLLVATLAAPSLSQAHDASQHTRPAVKPQVTAQVQTVPKVSPQHPAPVQTLPEKITKVSPQHPAPVQTLPEKITKVSPLHPAPVQTLPERPPQRPQVLPPRPGPYGYVRPLPRPYGGSGQIWDGPRDACRPCYRLTLHQSLICCRRSGTCC